MDDQIKRQWAQALNAQEAQLSDPRDAVWARLQHRRLPLPWWGAGLAAAVLVAVGALALRAPDSSGWAPVLDALWLEPENTDLLVDWNLDGNLTEFGDDQRI